MKMSMKFNENYIYKCNLQSKEFKRLNFFYLIFLIYLFILSHFQILLIIKKIL